MSTILGLDCEVFYNSGSFGTPSWDPVDAIRDATLELAVNEVDASRRGSGGWRQMETTLKEATLNVTFVKDKADTEFAAIASAVKAGTAIELAAADGANASGTEWLDAMWKATQWNETQDLEGVVLIEAVFRPTPDANLTPNWGSGTLPTTRP